MRRREAGLRTFTLICLGSTLAMLLSIWIPQIYPGFLNGDPGRIAAQVLTGIGFLGAGVNKILTITCSTSMPDLKKVRETISSYRIYIVSSSYEYNYEANTSKLTYKVSVNVKSSYSDLFAGIRELGNVSQIKMLT